MPRPRVLSFMTEWSSRNQENNASNSRLAKAQPEPAQTPPRKQPSDIDTITPQSVGNTLDSLAKASNIPQSPTTTPSRARGDSRASVRPNSMIQTYNPPQVDVAQDTPPELQPIFSFLNSHSNKLYQEGYFLKLHDLDSRGRPSGDRTWAECFAQLVGTVLSLWDAAALDVAGEDGEVVPTFINLSDASIKMIESLPMSGAQGGSLQNVLSISTAANNRYLLHFNSYSSLTQWTAGIRLAMFEHATLQEAYTGSLIAGKGRFLNNIKNIMERSRFAHDDWARVRFGAGTPWKRCWCVISPPDEKEFAKAQKNLKKSAYDRSVKVPKGDIKFYDTRKVTKKTRPIATITDAYAAYAIYPQSKPLIDQSTLVKLEGLVTIHTAPETTAEGFVFVMPEVHPAVSGFEMLLRWLFPVYDTFGLYGRPTRLIADTLDQRGLMFAMPKDRRYGYLDILDVSSLIHTAGSPAWSERQWRREMKKLTSDRMLAQADNGPSSLRQMSQRRNTTSRTSLPGNRGGIRFDDGGSPSSSPVSREASPLPRNPDFGPPRRTDSAPPTQGSPSPHKRSASDAPYRKHMADVPSRLSYETSRPADDAPPPAPPKHGGALGSTQGRPMGPGSLERIQSEAEVPTISTTYDEVESQTASPNNLQPIVPVASPPAFQHNPGSHPANRPAIPPELRRAHSNVDAATLYQMEEAARGDRTPEEDYENGHANGQGNRVVLTNLAHRNGTADRSQGMVSNSSKPQYPHEPAQSPGTLGGSPYGYDNRVQPYNGAQWGRSQTDIPQEQGPSPQTFDARQRPAPPQTMSSSKSISRKPVPTRAQEPPQEASPVQPPPAAQSNDDASSDYRANSFEGDFFDPDALDRVLSDGGDRASTMQSAASTEPDYASTVSSHKPRESIERPRAGKLKTVGNPGMPAEEIRVGKLDKWREGQKAQETGLPSIDFGPTYAYKPSSRPGTSGTMMPGDTGDQSRSRSQDRLRSSGRVTPSGIAPNDNRRHSYFGDLTSARPGSTSPNEDPSNQVGNRHSIAWTPGRSSPQPPQRNTLTPEQWVQHRSALASQPQYAPPRKPTPTKEHDRVGLSGSANLQQNRRSATKTPEPLSRAASADWSKQQERGKRTPEPFARSSSADWTKQLEHRQKTPEPLSRTASGDWSKHVEREQRTPPSRPHSRGANAYLNQQATLINSHSNTLSAKEQMHVARATGTPMLAKPSNKPSQDSQNVGLVGAIGAREREKAAMKAGNRNSMAVENAIRARQQQQIQAEQEAQMAQAWQWQNQQQRVYAQSMMGGQGMMSGAPSMMGGQGMMSGAPSVMGMSQAPSQFYPPPHQQTPQPRPGMPAQNRSSFYGASSPSLYQQQQQAPPQPQQQFGYGSTYGQMLQQQQAQGGNRQSWYGGSAFGGQQPPTPGGQGQWQGRQ